MSVEVLSRETPKANKNHVCSHCHQRIEIGEVYERLACADSGQAWTFKSHTKCSDLYNAYGAYYALDEYDLVSWHDVLEWDRLREKEILE